MRFSDKSTSISEKQNQKKLIVFLISVLIMAVWIIGLNWLFTKYTATNYFLWYLKNGTLISILTSFLALVWEELNAQKGLFSIHPAIFFASCAGITGTFFFALGTNLIGPLDGIKKRAEEPVSVFEAIWDGIFSIVIALLMMFFVLGWLLVISPLYYFLNLFTGALARRAIRDTGIKVVIKEDENKTIIKEQHSAQEVPVGWIDVSFSKYPFALTNVINAAVIFIANTAINTI